MVHPSLELGSGGEILSQAFRAIRKKRNMVVADVARAMGMQTRTYEQFEAGRGPLTHDRIFAFAEVTDSDAIALILSPTFGSPLLAIESADTKFVTIIAMHLQEFVDQEQGDIAYLDPTNIIGAVERLFRELGDRLKDRERFIQNWFEQRTGSIGLANLRLRGVKRRPGPKS